MKDSVTAKQIEATIALFITGSSLVTGSPTQAGQDTWLCLAAAFVLNIPMLYIHSQIIELYPGRNYFDNIIKACGKPAGKALCALLLIYSLHIMAFVTKTFCAFIQTVSMPETPFVFITLSILLVAFYICKKRVGVLASVAKFSLPFLLLTVAMTLILAYKDFDFSNLKPTLQSGMQPLVKGTVLLFTLPFGESVLCAPLFCTLDKKEKVFPVFLKGMLIGFAVVLAANLRNLLILGAAEKMFTFPSYEAVSDIKIGDFFTRIEVVIGFNLLLAGFVKASVAYFACCSNVQKIFDFEDYPTLLAPCALVIVTIIMLFSANTEELFGWLKYHAAFALPFQVIIPAAALTVGRIRKKA